MPGPIFISDDSVELRTIEEDDIFFLTKGINHPDVWQFMGHHRPKNEEQQQEWFNDIVCGDDKINLLICDNGEPVGIISSDAVDDPHRRVQIGIWLDPTHHSEGKGTAAMNLFINYLFTQCNAHKVVARVYEFNEASQRMCEKAGMTHEATMADEMFVHGEYQDLLYYSIMADQFYS